MKITLTDEQSQFRDSVRRLVIDHVLSNKTGSVSTWEGFLEIGLTGLCVHEDKGGFSGQGEDIAIIAMELGRAPLHSPRIELAVLAARLLEATDNPFAKKLLANLVKGERPVAVYGLGGRDIQGVPIEAVPADGGYRLSGKSVALGIDGMSSDFLVLAAIPNPPAASPQLAVFLVSGAPEEIKCKVLALADGTAATAITLNKFFVMPDALLLSGFACQEAVETASDEATVMACAELVGNMDKSIELTIEYLKLRQQFGRALSEFQALQHQVADLYIEANEARSILYAALSALRGSTVERQRTVSGCKVKVARAARNVTGQALHLHGGIGFTTEYAISHHYRRAVVDEKLFGGTEEHLERHVVLSESQ